MSKGSSPKTVLPQPEFRMAPRLSLNNNNNDGNKVQHQISSTSDDDDAIQSSRKYKLICSLLVYFGAISYGLVSAIPGPTLNDVTELLATQLEDVSQGFVYRSACYCIGALSCGYLFTLINRQIGLSLCLLLLASSSISVPYLKSLPLYYVSQSFAGFASAGIDVANNAWLIEMWSSECSPYLQSLHFGYSIGAVFAPLIAESFLSPDKSDSDNSRCGSNSTSNDGDDNSTLDESTTEHYAKSSLGYNGTYGHLLTPHVDHETRVHIPFIIVSSVMFCAAALLVVLYMIRPYKEIKRTSSVDSTAPLDGNSISGDNASSVGDAIASKTMYNRVMKVLSFKSACLLSSSVIFCFVVGSEMNIMNFLTSFITSLCMGKSLGVHLNSGYLAAFTVSRGYNILLATKLSPDKLLFICLALVGSGNILSVVVKDLSEGLLWACMILIGLGFGGMYAATYSFVEENIRVTTRMCGLFVFSSSLASMVNPLIIGKFIESFPYIFIYYNLFSFVTFTTSFFILYSLITIRNRNSVVIKSHGDQRI